MNINNPSIPYNGAIQGGLKPGMFIYFRGTVLNNITRFHINLVTSDNRGRAIHFNPRFKPQEVVVFNTFRQGRWESEERVNEMPLKQGEEFDLIFMVTYEGYQVLVNSAPFYLFKHRMPVELVTGLQVAGDVSMRTIFMDEADVPMAPPAKQFSGGGMSTICSDIQLMSMPIMVPIHSGLSHGMSLYFKGSIPQDIKRFHINLQNGVGASGNKALHFNPRFEPGEVVVFNSFRRNAWENEERPSEMPFSKGEDFEIVMNITAQGYQVIVNGSPFHLFKHRLPVATATAINIDGDVSIQCININMAGEIEKPARELRPARPVKEQVSPNIEYIYGGLRSGMSLYFKGTVPTDCNGFSINLHCGSAEDSDNAFHFNPRFNQGLVVFNSCRNGNWEERPIGMPEEMPFSKGEDFELVYNITAEGYQVILNGNPFFFFEHRMPLEDVTTIRIVADVTIETINIIEGGEGARQGYLSQGRILAPNEDKFTGTIYGGLREGMYLYFRGTVFQKVNRFHINLQYSHQRGQVKAMHFNPRFKNQPTVVFNTKVKKNWQKEERVNSMPFRKGESFEVLFYVGKKGYRIFVNGSPFYTYKHRVPLQHVNVIRINGDVSMDTADIIGGGKGGMAGYQGLRKILVPSIPHVEPIFGGLSVGTHLYFRGVVPVDITRFHINLQFGQMEGSAIALHFNPRFTPKEVVVFNTFKNGKWELEERVNQMPFLKGESFELVFIITEVGYQVMVNGRPLYLFKHRLPMFAVSALNIGGDISMETVNMINGVQGALEGHPRLGKMAVTTIPHWGAIYGGLRMGMALYFRGTVAQDSKRFSINLLFGQLDASDNALHFNPRFDTEEVVVFNTYRNGSWEKEERPAAMPFRQGEEFEIVFLVTEKGYKVNVNGRHFYLFKHRMPLEHVNAIMIGGDPGAVTMQTVNITEAGKLGIRRQPGLRRMTISSIPFVGTIQGGLRTGIYMYFRGKVPQDIKRFAINLQYGQMERSDKALHFNPRFDPKEVVVFNSFRDGSWEQEERVNQMPFRKGEDFEIVIVATRLGYQVIVNGRPLHLFRHRMPVEHVKALAIAGDVSMESLNLIRRGHARGRMVISKITNVGHVYGGLRAGMFLVFRGTIPEEIDRFAINMQCGELEGSDIAMHFNPRFDTNMVVFNSYRNDQWEKEERVCALPFQKGQNFELIFIITPKGYQVAINGRQFYFFAHRMPVDLVSAMKINGNVSVQDVETIGGEDDEEEQQEGLPDFGRLVINKIPHVGPIQRSLRTGIALHFQGVIPEQIDSFAINLQCGQMEGCDKALHFNPRFKPSEVVVFNSFQNGKWEKEERVFKMPFTPGDEFEITILITSQGYQVFVNGEKFYLFLHRLPVELVSGLGIAGDVSVETVDMKQQEPEEKQPEEKEVARSISELGPISGGLRPGMSIYFKGTVPDGANRFDINLLTQESDGYANMFHFNPRFSTSVVVFNTFEHGWQNEERPTGMPFRTGKEFEVLYIITSEGYQVKVNGKEFHLFKHRLPVEKVAFIRVGGDVSMQIINIIEQEPEVEKKSEVKEVVPISELGPISGGLRPGMSIYFKGTVRDGANRFDINLQTEEPEGYATLFHFNPRFSASVVVFNTYDNGWQNEERPTGMPFSTGEEFEVLYIITSEGYQVKVNGKDFYLFKHRIPMEKVAFIRVGGDASMQIINIIEQEPGVAKKAEVKEVVPISELGPISGGLRPGMSIYFKGTVPDGANRFDINLHTEEPEGYTNMFHFNPRFSTSVVVFNTYDNGWQNEERPTGMPFSTGEEFEVLYIITSEGYQVKVNGEEFYLFKHRIPVEKVAFIRVGGDVSMQIINIIENISEVGPISGGLRPGMSIYFKGTVPDGANRFDINLQTEEPEGYATLFHFNPRFSASVVVFNTYDNGWQNEERPTGMPFSTGEEFEVLYIITSEGYQVKVNGKDFYLFKHRIPVEKAAFIRVGGDASMQIINIIEQEPGVAKKAEVKEVVPISELGPISGGLRPGMSIYFKGTVPDGANRFDINLHTEEPEGYTNMFHFNPRFSASVVVFNTYDNGWQNEERPTGMPFSTGEEFEVLYVITSEGYQVKVNGEEFYLFKHRIPVEKVAFIRVGGDVSMQIINIIENISEVGPISGGLRPGMSIYFKGTVPDGANRFDINLQTEEPEGYSTLFHFNPRFSTSVVVFNTYDNGWQNEERPTGMPFSTGEEFEVLYIITSEGYQVKVNGKDFYLFKHRIPVEKVAFIRVGGDASMQIINIIEQEPEVEKKSEVKEVVPISELGPISGGLRPGMSIYFKGTVPDGANRFDINLQTEEPEGYATLFHFNPRFSASVVVFNTYDNGWQNEERPTGMPFSTGEEFEVLYIITSEGYQVKVNGEEFYLFKHRIPVEKVAFIRVGGDVSMQIINIIENISEVGPISGGLRPGMSIYFKGTVPDGANRFDINLHTEEPEGYANLFHFNPRFSSSVVVFNTYQNGWKNEERPTGMPFSTGEEFEVLYIITSEGYQVKVNGKEFYLFKHRIPVEKVAFIRVGGDVSMQIINIIEQKPGVAKKAEVKEVVPSVSKVGPIYGGLRPGMSIYFKGTIHDVANRFDINLHTEDSEGYANMFHFNPRFSTSVVVFNAYENGWQNEERPTGMPFSTGEEFEILYIITSEGYQVNVNGKEFYLFKHRLPVEKVSFITLGGDVTMQTINIIEGGQEGIPEHLSLGSVVVKTIPHVGPIYGGVRKGMYLYFRGKIDDDISRFHINLQCGEKEDSEKALHFNPRFEPTEEVVFNTFRDGTWGEEEVVHEMPFTKGEDFELVFVITPKGYQVIVNGRLFYMFMHRMPVEQVSTLDIDGDISIKSIKTIGGGPGGILGYRGLRNILVTKIPHVGPVLGGLRTGTYLYFRGTVPEEMKSFHINLQYGQRKGCDIPLHFKPQFEPHAVVVFNTFRNGKWATVDVVREMPFTKGKEFELVFIITSVGYQVVVNGRLFYLFKHRMPVQHVGALVIEGDVTMQTANMIMGGKGGVHPSLGKMVVTKIPHVGPVYGGLRSGMYLYFKGTLPEEIKGFAINLQYGQVEGCDIALHFNPRFDPSEVVVFNTFQKGEWQQEEKVDMMPFTKGEDFELLFILTSRGYQVNVNGRQFYLFKHRMPVENVSAVNISGDISVQDVDMTEGGQEEEQADEGQIVEIPHLRSIRGGLKPGMYLYFKGTIPQDIKRFTINLQYGQTKDTDIALHFNPRFDTEEVVVFNTFRNGNWEKEEKLTEMPFRKGEDFEIFIFVTSAGYQVNVNGRQFHLFKHRMPVDQVSALNVVGDVTMQTFNLIRGGPGIVRGQPGLGKVVVTKIPHVGPVYGGLRPGMYLYFWGTIPHSIESFNINLQSGQISECDKAFHFNPRFTPSEVVVFNSFRNGNWESEERVDVMPFQKGGRFELLFMITLEGYQVVVNGRPFYLFKHRMPVEHVTAVNIAGDVSVQTINTIVSVPGQGHPSLGKMVITTIPHVGPVYGGLRPGMALYFRGTVPKNINRFSINLQSGELDGCDKVLHFNPRFKPSEVVVFNTFRNGKWENEETVDAMPFVPGESFELLIIVTKKGYKVKVNGRVFYTFLHRMPAVYVSAVKIAGDITMETGDITEGEEEEEEKEKVIPSIPQVELPSGGLVPGMALIFQGTIPQKAYRCSINLVCGSAEDSDNAFHFNPRFYQDLVVFNTCRNGNWEDRPEDMPTEMPFQVGEDFELVYNITAEGYQVKVNDREFYLFKHRMPLENVTVIKIAEDISIHTINITEGATATTEGRLSQGKMVVDSMPYVGYMQSRLRTGMYLYFRGIIPQDQSINGFSITLECGDKKESEKALLFKTQFQPSEVVVFNSFQNGNWESEEKVDGIPFNKGENFELVFIVTTNGYQVMANGRRFYLFKHRVPLERVVSIKIVGDAAIETIDLIGGAIQRSRGLQKIAVTKIPHVGPVFGALRTGTYLYFRGTVPQEPDRFWINLQYGQVKDSDVAFHFSPRFDSNVVVFNTFRNGKWEEEERPAEMPFRAGEDFEIVIFVTSEGYQVNVNGRSFHLFKHRMPVELVSALQISGKVTMQTVDMIGLLTEYVFQGGEGGVHPSLGKMVVTKIPHVGPVYGGLRTGMFLTFRGTLPEEMERFSINLQYGQIEGSDIALHFNPRLDSDVVVFNTFRGGNWEEEERPSNMPFQKGKDFEIVFLINTEGYQVYVNGRHFHLFKHRMPVEHVSAIKIAGDVSMKTVDMTQQGKGAPELPPPEPAVVSTTPHLEPIPHGLNPGMYLYFKGTVPEGVKSFSINLQYGQIEGCDIALHFNPRLDSDVVVFNTFRGGNWEEEERPTEMPFNEGKDFEMVIIVTTEGYQVLINGRHFHLYKHRMPVETVSAIGILGDVSIQSINMIEEGQRQLKLGKIAITKIPHVEVTYGGLRPGMYLYFKGTVPEDIKSFAINLQYSQIEGSDIAFHFNPRFDPSPVVVFNSFKNSTWETEERVDVMPFTKGDEFEVLYIITSEGYQVNINGRQYYLFKHRMPVENVSAVNITGDISMETLNMVPGGQTVEGDGKIEVPSIPHMGPVYGGLRPGMALFFSGTIPKDIQSFAINLRYGAMKGSDIAFHFNPRFEPSEKVVFNSFKDDNWEEEESLEEMPLEPGESFEMAFLITVEGYQVIINSLRYYLFKHRMPVEQVSALEITGNIVIQSSNMVAGDTVQIEEKPVVEEPEILPDVEQVYGLVIGKALYFKGTLPSEITSFAINLVCGNTKGSDIAFHFNPRFEAKTVVLNSFQNGGWETEEIVNEMPFNKGESFELVFIVTAEGYQVYVNRHQFCFFKHRIPVLQVFAVQVIGEVFIQTTSCIDEVEVQKEDGDGQYPSPAELGTIQFTRPVPGTFKTETTLTFQGMVLEDTKRFSINLHCGDTEESDIAFHFSPQFETSEVVFNAFRDGSWEEAEKVEKMPFTLGEKFVMVYIITLEGYQVNINDTEFYFFKHRIPLEQVRKVQAAGDVYMIDWNVEEPVPKYPSPAEFRLEVRRPIEATLKTGTTLKFSGLVFEASKRFSINLCCGDTEESDIAFHFSPQFETSEVVFNTFRDGSWEEAEKVEKMPFILGENCEVLYIITSEGYQVNINGTEFYFFKHRIPLEQVKEMKLCGDVYMAYWTVKEPVEYPSPAELGTIQFHGPFESTLKTGTTLFFNGVVNNKCKRFSINLWCGDTEDSDIAFHFSPQFETSEVVFNSFQNGSWGEAERVEKMPFTLGESFWVDYIITSEGYQVNMNNTESYFFKHRMLPEEVKEQKIAGDVYFIGWNIGESVPKYPSPAQLGTIQFTRPVPGTFKTETTLTFRGMVLEDTKRFSINLHCGDTEESDIAFHLSPQFETSEVVFNTFRDGSWEEAEKVEFMPFTLGENFVMVYIITLEGYQVNINDTEFYFFKHRIPLEQVRKVQVAGDVYMIDWNVEEPEAEYPSPAQLGTIQFTRAVPGTFKTETTLTFQGLVFEDTKRFSINLHCGDTEESDIAFHFSPQFETSEVVFNAFRDGSWEEAEKVAAMPFTLGAQFVMVYIITLEGYQVNINGTEFYFFKHRIPLEQVKKVQAAGDVYMIDWNVEEPVPKYPSPAQLGPVQSVAPMPPMKVGMSMGFKGVIPLEITRFCINLQTGVTESCDTAFHMNVLFETSEVVFNTFRDGSWEEEEKVAAMPFTKGESFLLMFIITAEGYEVNVNGLPFHIFKHRISFDLVQCVQVIGDVVLQTAPIIVEKSSPSPARIGPVQCVVPLPESLKSGMSLSFEGSIPEDLTCFCINFQCGDADDSDTAFHFSPQFDTSDVVFNSFQHGTWAEVEKVDEMPFSKGQGFVLLINVTSRGYQVMVNGNELYFFSHRIPVERVTALQIIGNVIIQALGIIETAPSVMPLPGGLALGTTVTFLGMIPNESTGFNIDLQCGTAEGSDTAFRFNPQFDPSPAVVFNSCQGGSWETEERVDEMPFHKGENFELSFIITAEGYQVIISGQKFHMFKHRIPIEQVRSLQIAGNVNIPTVNIIEGKVVGISRSETVVVTSGPTVVPLPDGVKEGTSLGFKMSVPAYEKIASFYIDLMCGEAAGSDLALHFESKEEAVFNSFQGGAWGEEEKVAPLAFHAGDSFELVFNVTKVGYQVMVSGAYYHMFAHRIPLEHVTAMQIFGNTNLEAINIIEGGVFDMGGCGQLSVSGGGFLGISEQVMVVSGPTVVPLPDVLMVGTSVSCHISVPEGKACFSIDLMCGEAAGSDLALHFESKEEAVFNSFQGGAWGEEEKVAPLAFHGGDSFELVFNVTKVGYQVKVNGDDYHLFAHRIPLEHVTAMLVNGNVNLESINIIQGGVFDMGGFEQMPVCGGAFVMEGSVMGGSGSMEGFTCELQEIPMGGEIACELEAIPMLTEHD